MRSPTSLTNGALAGPSFVPLTENSQVDRNEFVRLVLQALNEGGFSLTAKALSEEAGVLAELPQIAQFRASTLSGEWTNAIQYLRQIDTDYDLHESEYLFLIGRQKYLELLEAKQSRKALAVLRTELAPLQSESTTKLHALSSLMMCTDIEDLKSRAKWSGVAGDSRSDLLRDLQKHLPTQVMLPAHRLESLLQQARQYQCMTCAYHITPTASSSSTPSSSAVPFSLLNDHSCPRQSFPNTSAHILSAHTDEVWAIAFSHNGEYLASAGADKAVLLWSIADNFSLLHSLTGHTDGVFCLAWSPDDSILLTSADLAIKMWDPKTGTCVRTLSEHQYTVSALVWMPDGNSFVSAGMDAKLYFWDLNGNVKYTWRTGPYRIVDATISPDGNKLVVVGKAEVPITSESSVSDVQITNGRHSALTRAERRLQIFDISQQKQIASITQPRDLTCVTISDDSAFALVNEAPNELRLYNLEDATLSRRFKGHSQGEHILKSCFGGRSQNFVITGSEDSKIYVWHRETGALIDVLSGHSTGSVNAVAWNPAHSGMLASAGDDGKVRIWLPRAESSARKQSIGNGHADANGST